MTKERSTHLYRHYNSQGKLLYIGVSLSAVARLSQHEMHSHWFTDIARVEVETYGTRKDALEAEAKAIKEERPAFNIAHAPKEAEPSEFEKAELGRRRLFSRTVNFKPLYTVQRRPKLWASPRRRSRRRSHPASWAHTRSRGMRLDVPMERWT